MAYVFRNGPIEDLHAGKSSPLLDEPGLSRITDEEMKKIMINACEKIESLLREKAADPEAYYVKIMGYNHRYCREWVR